MENDEQIVKLFQNGDENAFEDLYKRYARKVFGLIYRIVQDEYSTEDLMQNVFVKVHQHLPQFKFKSTFSTWLYRIALNEAYSSLKKMIKKKEKMDDYDKLENIPNEDDHQERKEIKTQLKKAVNHLSKKQRLVFNLRFYEEMPFKIIGQVLKMTENSAKVHYHTSLKKMKYDMEGLL